MGAVFHRDKFATSELNNTVSTENPLSSTVYEFKTQAMKNIFNEKGFKTFHRQWWTKVGKESFFDGLFPRCQEVFHEDSVRPLCVVGQASDFQRKMSL